MSIIEITLTDAESKGLDKAVADYNANHTDAPHTAASFVLDQLTGAREQWRSLVLSMPAASFVLRFSGAEIAAIVDASEQSPELAAYLTQLKSEPHINLTDERVTAGLAQLQAAGLLTAERVAEILAP